MPGLAIHGERVCQVVVQALLKLSNEARSCLRYARLARYTQLPARVRQQAQTIQQAAQDVVARRLHMDRQRHDEKDH